jgi:hypothetical protein
MSARAFAAVRTLLERGELEVLTTGSRCVLLLLADECDDLGDAFTCVATEERLARMIGGGVSTARRHLAALEAEGLIGRVREREPDGTWGGYRTSLSLEKLRVETVHRSNRAVAENPVPATAQSTAHTTAQSTAQIEQPPLDSSGPKEGLPACLLKYGWPSEDMLPWASRILSVAGPGLADPETDIRVLAKLADALPGWMATFDLEADIVPVVSKAFPRRRAKPLIDISQLTEDIWAQRMARKREAGTPANDAAPVVQRDVAAARGLAITIRTLEDGARPEWLLLPDERSLAGEAREAAFARGLARLRARHAALLGETPAAGAAA